MFDEDVEFPWGDEYGFEDWYYSLPGKNDSNAFKIANPLPVIHVNYCSKSEPMYVLASQEVTGRRGFPHRISEEDTVVDEAKSEIVKAFCLKHKLIQESDAPSWYLCSFWEE